MTTGRESGFALVPLLAAVLLGALFAGAGAFSLVTSLSATPEPVDKPLITYDRR